MKFSVLIAHYNNYGYFKQCYVSLKNQTYQNFEWIIIDGASSDGTVDDFIHYTTANIISEKDNGIYDAMNKGLDRAAGDYLIFMNAGDIFANTFVLEKLIPSTKWLGAKADCSTSRKKFSELRLSSNSPTSISG